jgi:hypothetical protein
MGLSFDLDTLVVGDTDVLVVGVKVECGELGEPLSW